MKPALRISAVKYLNTQPYIYGLQEDTTGHKWDLQVDTPADCAQKLVSGEVDIGLVPVASIPYLNGFRPITEWGIGADGPVHSVLLLSEFDISRVATIYLDYQSRTSNALLSILVREYFSRDLLILDSNIGYEDQIRNEVAGLVIGDRALQLRSKYPYCYDLAELWKELTGLPFVFARWVAADCVREDHEMALISAFEQGMKSRNEIATKVGPSYPNSDIQQYLNDHIKYKLGPSYWEGLALFREKQRNTINSLT